MKNLRLPTWIEKNRENLIALIAAAVMAFFFLLNSPMHLWRYDDTWPDSSVFKTVALMMDNGYMPYKDTFDHKGPLLYTINYWGLKISYFRGVWVFEAVFLTITLFTLYKIARLRTQKFSSALVVLTAMSYLYQYFEGGNLSEEYAMPFIAIGIYIFLDYLLNDRISWHRIAISGFSLGGVCLLRPNMIAVWIVFCAAIFFRKIWEKDWKQLRRFVLWFVVGFSVMVLPFVVWLASNGALQSGIEDYILFNMRYSSAEGGFASFSSRWNIFFTFACSTIYFIAFIGIVFHLKDNSFLNITYAAYMVIGLILLSMSGQGSGHYGMVLVPAVVYPLSLVMEDVEKLANQYNGRIVKMLVTICLMAAFIIPASLETIKAIPSYYENRGIDQSPETTKQLCETVKSLTSEDDAISVYGNWDLIYVKTRRKHATKYSFQYPISQVMPEILDKYFEQLKDELPSVIVVQAYCNDEKIIDFLKHNGYEKVWPENLSEEEITGTDRSMVFYRPQE